MSELMRHHCLKLCDRKAMKERKADIDHASATEAHDSVRMADPGPRHVCQVDFVRHGLSRHECNLVDPVEQSRLLGPFQTYPARLYTAVHQQGKQNIRAGSTANPTGKLVEHVLAVQAKTKVNQPSA